MFNFLFILFFASIFPKESFDSGSTELPKLSGSYLDTAIIHDADGFFPTKIYLRINTNLKLKISNLLNRDASFINSKLNIFKNIKPNSSSTFEISFKKSGVYEFKCPLNTSKMEIVVE